MKKTVLSALAVMVLGVGSAIPQAHADFMIRVTDQATQTVTDNMLGDLSDIDGFINTQFTTANFDLVATFGTSKPLGGNSDSLARIDLTSINVTSNTGGTLIVEITDTDFSLSGPTGNGSFSGSIGGTLGINENNNLSVNYYYDPTNAAFGTGGSMLSSNLFSGAGSFGQDLGPLMVTGVDGPFSLTQVVTINMNENDLLSYDSDLMVQQTPEPTSFLLFGSGLAGLGYMARRKHKKA